MSEPATLIWHRDPADVPNRDWIRFLLSDVVCEEVVDLEGCVCPPHSIVVEDTRSKTPTSFFRAAALQRAVGLFHISDQYFSFDYDKYHNFDFVIKTHWSSAFEVDRLLVVPIGYQSDLSFRHPVVPASQRPLLWAFAGGLKSSRFEMVRILKTVEPNVVHPTTSREQRLRRKEYIDLFEKSAFSPSPMGNVIMESWRLYESLEAGCIPIVEKRPFLAYYENLLASPPFIFVAHWEEAKEKMLQLAANRTELDCLQERIYGWWQGYKITLKERVTTHVNRGFASNDDSARGGVRVKRVAKVPGWHYAELLRHQSLTSLRWRFGRNVLGGRLKVPF